MKTRGLVAVLLLLTGLQSALAQKLKLYFSDKQVVEYSVEKVDSLVFTDGAGDTAESHEWVDLGLPSGTLWATCNVGASSPEEYGDYFAWGETEPKETYYWSTYKYCKGTDETLTKYCTDSYYGTVDNKTELEPSDDAATANWGSGWQMPSREQCDELYNSSYTTTTWTTMNGKYGRKITSKSNGNSIFLPAAGNRYGTSLNHTGSDGYYWSRLSYSNWAYCLGFDSSDISTYISYRRDGQSVRPVRTTNSAQTTVQKIVLYMEGNQTIECNASELDSIVFVDTEAEENDVREYVDLGLPSGTLWATCNVGANSPEEYGDYFAWGETEPKSDYSWSTYKYYNGTTLTKYCTDVDNKTELEPSDDAATVNWGSEWQMPSDEQIVELFISGYTTTTWTIMNGVYGRKITSKSNGNSIFLPAAGYRDGTSLNLAGSDGMGLYWSRPLSTSNSNKYAYCLGFNSSDISTYNNYRYCGQSVRPVRVNGVQTVAVSNIELSQTVLSVMVGETSQLSATVLPDNASNKDIKWESSNADVATVDQSGKVSAVAVGDCIITCSATDGSGVTAACQVKVQPIVVTSIELNHTEDSVKVGETLQLSATVLPDNATNKNVKWASSNADVATVDETGKVVAVAVGTCTIICFATDGSGVKAECQVTVSEFHEYIDLGLPSGTLWATCNVGANSPEEYGDYFAWGETEPKTTYNWSTYKYCKGSYDTMTKYCTSSDYGIIDNKTELEAMDDAATVNWGSEWQIPSKEQIDELIIGSNTTTTWTTMNGVKGAKITSKSNGNSIFLPAAGWCYNTSLNYAGSSDGYYWSRSLSTSSSNYAHCWHFNSSGIYWGDDVRYHGQSVRPVRVNDRTVDVSNIELSQTELYVMVGETSQLSATVLPWYATNKKIQWESSNADVATVDQSGKVTAVAGGTCTITCSATDGSGIKAECKVTVETHAYVDLGLPSGTLWATCNVGANSPEEYGDYFAWGETTMKSSYNGSTYKYCKGTETTMTKYCTDSKYGTVDNKTELEAADDAATVNWGSNWQMPSLGQVEELTCGSYTNISWTTLNGVHGIKITSKSNGNSIFLPAAGWRNDAALSNAGSCGDYLSRSLDTSYSKWAYCLFFYSIDDSIDTITWKYSHRFNGSSVRPVRVR